MRIATTPALRAPRSKSAASKHSPHKPRPEEQAPASPRLAYLSRKALSPAGLERLSSLPAAECSSATASPLWAIRAGEHLTDDTASDAGLMPLFASGRRSTDLEAAHGRPDVYPASLAPQPHQPAIATPPCTLPAVDVAAPASPSSAASSEPSALPTLDLELSPLEAKWMVSPATHPVLKLAPADDARQARRAEALRHALCRAAASAVAASSSAARAAKRVTGKGLRQLRSRGPGLPAKLSQLRLACASMPAIK